MSGESEEEGRGRRSLVLVIMKLYSLRISLNSYKCTNPSEKGKRVKGEEDISGSVSSKISSQYRRASNEDSLYNG